MNHKKLLLFLLHIPLCFSMGFAPDTLVRTPRGFVEIKDLNVNDEVCSVDVENSRIVRRKIIQKTTAAAVAAYVHLVTDYDELDTGLSTPFFVTFGHGWSKAFELGLLDTLFGLRRGRVVVEDIDVRQEPIDLIGMEIEGDDHNFLVGQDELVVHNEPITCAVGVGCVAAMAAPPVATGLLTLPEIIFGTAAFTAAAVKITGFAKYLHAGKARCERREAFRQFGLLPPEEQQKQRDDCETEILRGADPAIEICKKYWRKGVPTPLIKTEADFEKAAAVKYEHVATAGCPHNFKFGVYWGIEYGTCSSLSEAHITRRPIDGQLALDGSFELDTATHRRVAHCNDEYVVFYPDAVNPHNFRGQVRMWGELCPHMQAVLLEHGVADPTRRPTVIARMRDRRLSARHAPLADAAARPATRESARRQKVVGKIECFRVLVASGNYVNWRDRLKKCADSKGIKNSKGQEAASLAWDRASNKLMAFDAAGNRIGLIEPVQAIKQANEGAAETKSDDDGDGPGSIRPAVAAGGGFPPPPDPPKDGVSTTSPKPPEDPDKGSHDLKKWTETQLRRSIRSFQKLIDEHQEKLEKYKENPEAHDNQGRLKDAPAERRQKIIDERIKGLQKEINEYTRQKADSIAELMRRGLT